MYFTRAAAPAYILAYARSLSAPPVLIDDPRTLPQCDPRQGPARYCCAVGSPGHLEIINASDVLDNAAALALRLASCLIDGEAVACDDNGLPVFDRLRHRRDDRGVFLYAFDLIELDGDDLRREPIEHRKVLLIRLLARAPVGLTTS